MKTAGGFSDATLRCVEAGMLPEGVLALYLHDPIARGRRIFFSICTISAAALVIQSAVGRGPLVAVGFMIGAGLIGVLATPAVRASDEGRYRPAVVVTATAILKREERGFRVWIFRELAGAQVSLQAGRMDLVLIAPDGARAYFDCGALESGHLLIEAVAKHIPVEPA